MTAKKWIISFVAVIAALCMILAAANVVIDPFGVFGDKLLDWYSYDMTLNPRAAKIAYLDENYEKYDSYIVGCSSTSSYPVEDLNKAFDASFYNMIMYGADMLDVENESRYIIENYNCKNLIVNVYIDNACHYDEEEEPLKYSMDPDTDGSNIFERAEYYLRYLSAKPNYIIDKLRSYKNDTYLNQTFDVFNVETGAYDKRKRDIENVSNLDDYLTSYPEFTSYPETSPAMTEIKSTAKSLQRICDMCDEAGVNLTVVSAPVYWEYFDDFDEEEYREYYNAIAEVTDFWDFSISSVSFDPRYFYDATHFRNSVGSMAVARMTEEDFDGGAESAETAEAEKSGAAESAEAADAEAADTEAADAEKSGAAESAVTVEDPDLGSAGGNSLYMPEDFGQLVTAENVDNAVDKIYEIYGKYSDVYGEYIRSYAEGSKDLSNTNDAMTDGSSEKSGAASESAAESSEKSGGDSESSKNSDAKSENSNGKSAKSAVKSGKSDKETEITDKKSLIESISEEVPVLLYHHLQPEADGSNGAVISVELFEKHMKALAENGYSAVSCSEVISYVEKGTPLPDNPVMITFDDGYRSNYEYAYPILKKYGLKATIFVIGTSFGSETYKDTDMKTIPHFGLSEAKEMVDSGVIEIQSHTYDMHQSEEGEALRAAGAAGDEKASAGASGNEKASAGAAGGEKASAGASGKEKASAGASGKEKASAGAAGKEKASAGAAGKVRMNLLMFDGESEWDYAKLLEEDAADENRLISKIMGEDAYALAYPNGQYSELTAAVLKGCGIKMTFTVIPGVNTVVKGLPQSLMQMKRFIINEEIDAESMLKKISGIDE